MVIAGTGFMAVVFVLGALTAMGARRRGAGIPLATLAGFGFPLTWTVWYLRDRHTYGGARS